MSEQSEDRSHLEGRGQHSGGASLLSRRKFLGAGATVGGALLLGDILAACGGGSSSTAAGTTAGGSSASSKKLGEELRQILGTPKNLMKQGPGDYKINAMLALTGPASIYGKLQLEGIELAIEHIEAWSDGNLKFDLTALDNKGAEPQASVQAARTAGESGSPLCINSFSWGFGASIPLIEQYEILSLDPGGGTGPIFQGVPFCYGTRANWPTDPQNGLTRLIRTKNPDAKNWALIQPEIAPEYNDAVTKYVEDLYAREGLNFLGTELAPIGQTDYSTVIQKVKEKEPDVVITMSYADDPAYQAKDAVRQGLDAIFGACDFTPEAVKLAGSAYADWYVGFDYLNTIEPPNVWTKLFVDQFEATRGETPIYYQAGYYVTTFIYAQLMDAVLGAGGDITKGESYLKALTASPSFPHVYGGKGKTLGKMVIDLKSHSPSSIPMTAFQAEGNGDINGVVPEASYNVGGREFKLLS